MLMSISLMLLMGMFLGWVCKKLKLPCLLGMIVLAPKLFHVSILEAAIIGTVVAAVSPAVIVPKMIKLIVERYGVENSIPQLILAGASGDYVYWHCPAKIPQGSLLPFIIKIQ